MRAFASFSDTRLPERFWSKVQPCPMSGCWIWTAAHNGAGYGVIRMSGKNMLAHRIVYEAVHGSCPDGKDIDHLCRVTYCCNPAHLEAVSHQENVRRGTSSEALKRKFATSTCRRGHARNEDNTYYRPNGKRDCRVCARPLKRVTQKHYIARKRAALAVPGVK